MKTKILFIFTLICCGCNSNYDYKEIGESEVLKNKNTLLQNTTTQKIYSVCKDYGAPLNDRCFLAIQKGNRYFKINPKYRYAVSEDSIYLFQIVSLDYSAKGNWVFIEKKNIDGKENIFFKYDTIPTNNITTNSKGVFYLKNDSLQKIGELTSFQSLHDLPNVGFYYLSSPGIFYQKVLAINEIK